MKCVVLQPSYIPWRGYFHQIYKADLFVFYDDVQYDRHGWRNRNRIKTPLGSRWLTIPLAATRSNVRNTKILEMRIAEKEDWRRRHLETLRHSYARAPYFERYRPMLERWYEKKSTLLADFTIETTIELAHELGIRHTTFVRSSTLEIEELDTAGLDIECASTATGRLVRILQRVGATHYISGPAAQSYLDENSLQDAGISLEWMTYNYPEYPQQYPPFDSQLSALDLLLQTGPHAAQFIWGN